MSVLVENEYKHVDCYYSHESLRPKKKTDFRHVGLQACNSVSEAAVPPNPAPVAVDQTPTKLAPPQQPIVNLPGRKSITPSSKEKANNRCNKCNVIYDSEDDKQMKKKYKRQATWLGCDGDGCNFWAHAKCAGVKIAPRQNLEDLDFFCPDHS